MLQTINSLIKYINKTILILYSVIITIPFLVLLLLLVGKPNNIYYVKNLFAITPTNNFRTNYCRHNLSIYKNNDLETIFFENKKTLDMIKVIGGTDTGFELRLNGWDDYWGCVTGGIDVFVVNYSKEREKELREYISSSNLPFRIVLLTPYKYSY